MKNSINISNLTLVEEIPNYWTNDDFITLLEQFDFPDAKTIDSESLREMLYMAISDFEPNEAAAIVLTHKLSEQLSEGQINQISNDMLLDKVSEEYPEIELHYHLFSVNQLLYKAFNGKFPNTKATIVNFSLVSSDKEVEITKEIVLKSFNQGLSDRNLIKRLYPEEMSSSKRFPDAEKILWELKSHDENNFTLITSSYWFSKDDIVSSTFSSVLEIDESDENE